MPDPTPEELAAEAKAKADADAKAAADKAAADAEAAKVKFSQADLDRIAGQSRSEGRTQAEKELLEKLGIADVDSAKAAIAAAKELEDAKKTEVEKLTEERNKAKAEAEEATKAAAGAVALARLEGSLRDAGIKPERIPAALKLADLSAVVVSGTDVEGVDKAVEGVKATSPEWFGKPAAAPDASLGRPDPTDFRTASKDERAKALEQYGIRI